MVQEQLFLFSFVRNDAKLWLLVQKDRDGRSLTPLVPSLFVVVKSWRFVGGSNDDDSDAGRGTNFLCQ